jgi:hypothetical protein
MVAARTKPKPRHGGLRNPPGGRPPRKPKLEQRPPKPTPLEYMLSVMNDNEADISRRDRMAIAAAPYVHGRPPEADLGKKQIANIVAQTAHESSDWGGLVN